MGQAGASVDSGSQAGAREGGQELAGAYHSPGARHAPRPDSLSSPGPLAASSAWLPWLRPSAQDKHLLALPWLRGWGLAKRVSSEDKVPLQPSPALQHR